MHVFVCERERGREREKERERERKREKIARVDLKSLDLKVSIVPCEICLGHPNE